MQNGKINPVAGIFLSKNWYGYKDAQEIKVEPTSPLGQALPEDELRKVVAGTGYTLTDIMTE
jgi:hypothetical protein